MSARVLHGDCLAVLRDMPDGSVHAVVTDPPYGLSNTDPAHVVETLTRWAAGERDYVPTGRGFMGKSWDAFVPPPAVWDECLRVLKPGGHLLAFAGSRTFDLMTLSIRFAGFDIRDSIAWLHGQGFPKHKAQPKPAFEPVVVARKPLTGTVAANVLAHGTGALNIDASKTAAGRWPTNVVLDGHAADALDEQGPRTKDGVAVNRNRPDDGSVKPHSVYSDVRNKPSADQGYSGEGGPSRFFPTFRYQAKAPTRERPSYEREDGTRVAHPTVKPVELMRWLVRLVTPPGGTVLDPFAGSGATVEAALLEGFDVTAIEREADYLPLIEQRIARVGLLGNAA